MQQQCSCVCKVSNKVLKVMMSSNEHKVKDVADELEEMKLILLEERDLKTVQFLNVLQVCCLFDSCFATTLIVCIPPEKDTCTLD